MASAASRGSCGSIRIAFASAWRIAPAMRARRTGLGGTPSFGSITATMFRRNRRAKYGQPLW
jgi:hypothetical protein